MAAKGAVVYTLAHHQALFSQGRVSEAQAAEPTHHGSNSMGQACARAPSVEGLWRELVVQERNQEGQGGAEQDVKTNFETVAGRGVYTSGRWGNAVSYSVPLLYPGQDLLNKIVLLVEVP